jgi:exodeoxyribonuclease VII small subunit
MQKLNEYVAWFESDDFVLEQAIDKYNEAKKLADSIQADLTKLKNNITVVNKQFDKE